ncbi:Hpt domain-containing protein [Daejeonella oryzae]|uniref:Hpt domain-containing protein n=1 Tax=Daejeonella oryzae TaxID=1122943 RepID=UPI000422DDBF|nr:Hpt domain-containing protein [Daejeonella oryzae]
MPDNNANNLTEFEIDLSYLSDVAGGSSEFMIEMIDMFLDQTPEYFEEIDQSINDLDWSNVATLAHKIKPTLAFMGVDFARIEMAELERKAKNLDSVETIRPMFDNLMNLSKILYIKLEEAKKRLLTEG